MTYKIWNKKDDIKGFSADYWIKSLDVAETDEVFIVLDANGTEIWVEKVGVIKSVHNMDSTLTSEQVAQQYIEMTTKISENSKQEIENKLTQQEEIEKLKQENASINYILMKNDLL